MTEVSDNGENRDRASGPRLPPKPEPEPCCGSGCDPCVLELYEEALERWERRVEAIKARYHGAGGEPGSEPPEGGR